MKLKHCSYILYRNRFVWTDYTPELMKITYCHAHLQWLKVWQQRAKNYGGSIRMSSGTQKKKSKKLERVCLFHHILLHYDLCSEMAF